MAIELYVFPPSPRAFKVMAVANHLDLDWTLQFIDLVTGDHKTPQYAELNPNMRIPTLKDGDFVLWESNAICQYLAAKRPESGLMPKDDRGQADVTRWQFWDIAQWDRACVTYIFEYIAKPRLMKGGEPNLAAVSQGAEPFHRAAKVLDSQLKDRKFVTGDTLTVADFSLGAPLIYAEMAHLPIETYAEIRRWFDALSALPAWQKTLGQSAPPAAVPA